jgi:hypothetical protein
MVPPAQLPVTPGAQPGFVTSARAIDYFQRALNYAKEDAFKPGGDSAKGFMLRNIREELLNVLDPNNPPPGFQGQMPGYRKILNNVRLSYGPAEALEAGRNMALKLGTEATRETMADYGEMDEAQRRLFRLGFVANLKDRAGETRGAAGLTTALMRSGSNTERMIRGIFSNKTADTLIRDLRGEGISTQTASDLLSGSRTAPMTSDMDEFMQGAHMVGQLATGNPLGAMQVAGKRLAYNVGKQQAGEAAKIMTETDPSKLLGYLGRMSGYAPEAANRQATMNMLAGYGGPAAMSAIQSQESVRPTLSDSRSRSVRETVSTAIPGGRARYDPHTGTLVVNPQ